jgi:hypothetical protein
MYTCYLLSEASRNMLLKMFPPKYPQVICHHVTIQYPATKETPLPSSPESIQVVGYLDDGEGLECFIVAVDGDTKRPSDGKVFHITHSLNSMLGYKPVDSNTLIQQADHIEKVPPIDLQAEPKLL